MRFVELIRKTTVEVNVLLLFGISNRQNKLPEPRRHCRVPISAPFSPTSCTDAHYSKAHGDFFLSYVFICCPVSDRRETCPRTCPPHKKTTTFIFVLSSSLLSDRIVSLLYRNFSFGNSTYTHLPTPEGEPKTDQSNDCTGLVFWLLPRNGGRNPNPAGLLEHYKEQLKHLMCWIIIFSPQSW